MGWAIEYFDGTNWVVKSGAVLKHIMQELNGHEEAVFIISNTSANRDFVSTDKKIRIKFNNEVIFRGKLYGYNLKRDGIECLVYNECYEIMKAKVHTAEYASTAASTILSAICSSAGVVAGSCPTTAVSVRYDRTPCFDAAVYLARTLAKDFWGDYDASDNPRFNIGDRVNSAPYPSLTPLEIPERQVDRAKKRDKVIVRGVDADGNPIYAEAGTGTNVAVFTERKAADQATLQGIASAKLAELNKESAGVKLPVKITQAYNLQPGYYVSLNIPDLGMSGDYRIWRITKRLTDADVEVDSPQAILERYIQTFTSLEDMGIYKVATTQVDIDPIAPSGFTADNIAVSVVIQQDGTSLSFFAVTIPRVEKMTGYRVRYRLQGSSAWTEVDVAQPPSGNPVTYAGPVQAGATYEFQVCSYNRLGKLSDWVPSTPVTKTAGADTTAPAAPTGLTATAGMRKIILTWNPNSELDLKEYWVYQNTTNNSSTASVIAKVRTTRLEVEAPAGTTYYFWVRAVDYSGNVSAFSAVASAAANGVNASDFASLVRPIQIVSSLPTLPNPNYPQGAVVFLTTDNKLYRSTGSSWTAVVPTTDLSGQITTTQIADNAITTPKLYAGAVTTEKLAAGSVTSDILAANSVTAGKIAAGAVGTTQLTADWITGKKFRTSGRASGGAGIEIDDSSIRGYSDATTVQFYLSASDGKAYAGGGNVILYNGGILVVGQNLGFLDENNNSAGWLWGQANPRGYFLQAYNRDLVLQAYPSSYRVVVYGDLRPYSGGTYYLGTSDYRWLRLFAQWGILDQIGPYSDTVYYVYFRTRNIAGSGYLDHIFAPLDGNWGYVGDSTYYWYKMYSNWIYASNVYPRGGDNTGYLGDGSDRWAYLYAVNKYAVFKHPLHNPEEKYIVFKCVEGPQVTVEDWGVATLVDGQAFVMFSEEFAALISDSKEYAVFLTPEGECRGLYVARKEPYGFEVRELGGGRSNIRFSWQVKAVRIGDEATPVLEDPKPKFASKEEELRWHEERALMDAKKEDWRLDRMKENIRKYRERAGGAA